MALPDLTGQNIENTYQRVLQTDGTVIYDGTGSVFLPVSASYAVTASYAEYAVSASHEIIKEVSSSYADYAKESGLSTSSISASYALTASYALNSPDTFPYTGSAIISGSLTVTGSTEIQHLTASGLNYPTTDGGEKQLITTDSSGNLSFDWSDRTNIDVKNTSGTTLEIGTPVYISGFQGASIFQISAASSSLPGTMPAVGILDQTLNDNGQGYATLLGAVRGIDTDTPGYSINQSLYVGEGTLTPNRPTGSALIQKIARVGSVANNGEITVLGAGRSNDVPNIQPGYAWVGDSTWNAIATPTSSFNEDPFPYTGSAVISGSLEVTGSISSTDTVTAVTGSFSHLKGNSPITVQDPVTFQQTLSVTGNTTLSSINGVDLQTISKNFNYTSSLVVTEITASVNGAIIDYRLTNLNSGSRVGTFMYAHDGTELSYNDLTIPGGGIGDQPILSASLANNLVTVNIENAAGFNFTGYAKKFNRLGAPIPVANPNLPTPLLDTYSGAEAAFSLRKLRTSYTGNAIRIRENGSNTEIDIGFDVNNNLDTTALVAHCGSNNGFVVTWYDQSGNGNDATQTTMANQPKIYDSVTGVVMENGNPAVDFDGTNDILNFSNFAITSATNKALFIVGANDETGSIRRRPFNIKSATGTLVGVWQDDNNTSAFSGNGFSNSVTITASNASQYLLTGQDYAGNQSIFLDGTAGATNTSGGTNTGAVAGYIGAYDASIAAPNNQAYLGRLQEIITYTSDQSSNRTGIESNINDYYDVYDTGLLAEYLGAAAAYSVRLLHSVYTGPSLRVREDSTDTEANIGFDSNGDLDTTALLAHCGSNNGFVVTWYDQSGNGNDATQATAANQPQIVSSGAVIVENGKPAVLNQGGLQELLLTSTINSSTNISAVAKANVGGWGYLTGQSWDGALRQNNGWYSNTPSLAGDYYYNGSLYLDGILTTSSTSAQQQRLIFANAQSGGSALSLVNIGGTYTNRHWNGPIQEIIYWGTDQSTNRTGIETNINSYFNIYP